MYQPQEHQRLLTAEEEIQLARRVHGDDRADAIAARDELVLHNVRLAYRVAGRMAKHWPALDREDLVGEAMVALVQVAERYDPDTHHTRFSTYALPDMHGRLQLFANRKRQPVFSMLDNRADPQPQPLEAIITSEEFSIAVAAINQLAPMRAYVIARRFGVGESKASSLREIAGDIGFTYEYVRQVEAKALNQLSFLTRSTRQNPKMII